MPRVIHFEIHAQDPGRAIAFYESVFGWTFTKWKSDFPYWLASTGESAAPGINGGLVVRRGEPPAEGQPVNAFVCTLDCDDVDGTLVRVLDSGGTLAVPKMAVAGVGWLAYCKDPEGNILGLMQSDPTAA